MLKNFKRTEGGFTIVELLIVIVVIGILAALVLNTFSGIQERARDTARRTDINSLATQLEVYYADHGAYLDGSAASTCGAGSDACAISTTTLPGLDAEALNDPNANALNVNSDPAAASDNEYHYLGAGCTTGMCTSFSLGSVLEQTGAGTYTKNSLNN